MRDGGRLEARVFGRALGQGLELRTEIFLCFLRSLLFQKFFICVNSRDLRANVFSLIRLCPELPLFSAA